MKAPNIQYGGLSHRVLMYAAFMRKKGFTSPEARAFFPHKFRKSSDVTRAAESLAAHGLLRGIDDGWMITPEGRELLRKMAKASGSDSQ